MKSIATHSPVVPILTATPPATRLVPRCHRGLMVLAMMAFVAMALASTGCRRHRYCHNNFYPPPPTVVPAPAPPLYYQQPPLSQPPIYPGGYQQPPPYGYPGYGPQYPCH